ncbi:hypothetical protein [Noviherbaspirillum sp.]|uniref:hypothetical protein n=1 Tax=Noviherbaspirillum sp. TaxID=1926288 RepID=UPI002FDF2214
MKQGLEISYAHDAFPTEVDCDRHRRLPCGRNGRFAESGKNLRTWFPLRLNTMVMSKLRKRLMQVKIARTIGQALHLFLDCAWRQPYAEMALTASPLRQKR